MKRTLIFRDIRMIEHYLGAYPQCIAKLQSIIDGLTAQGITLKDNVLHDLSGGGAETRKAVQCQIDGELVKVKFHASREELKKRLEPLPYKVDEAAVAICKALRIDKYSYLTIHIDINNLAVEALKVRAVSDLEEIITDKFSIYTDDPVMAEAYGRAQKLEKEINDYSEFLGKHGSRLMPVGVQSIYGHDSGVVIEINQDGKARIINSRFQSLLPKKHKR